MENEERLGLAEISTADEAARLSLALAAEQIPRLCTLLQKGCYARVRLGCSLRELLCGQFHISPDYVNKDIKVLFINYSPVDNIDTAIIRDGATLALSAAMPGLVGAALRKDGLAWMRTSITYQEHKDDHDESEGVIQVKLFNQVMADLGESFLRRGIYVKSPVLADFLGRFPDEFRKNFNKISRNGESISESDLSDFLAGYQGWVKLTIQ